MEWWSIIIACVAGALGIYYYCFKNLDYFKRRNLPHIKPSPMFGNMARIILAKEPISNVIDEAYNLNRKAKYVGFFDFMAPIVVLRDPELIKSISTKNFDHFVNHRLFLDEDQEPLFGKNLFGLKDDRWKDMRILLTPAFSSSKLKGMFKLMSDCAVNFAEFLKELPEDKKVMEMRDVFSKYTNDVIATCAFGIAVDSMRNPTNKFYTLAKEVTSISFIRFLKVFFCRSFPRLSKLLGFQFIDDNTANFFKDLIATTIRTRDEKNITRPDMLQLMMESRGKRGEGRELTIDDMTAQAFVFLFGGFATTSAAMCFIAHEIAVNPNVQEKLQKEIDKVLRETKGEVTYEAINKMEYLEAIINETLRRYTIIVLHDRVCTKDFELPPALPGSMPHMLKKGDVLWIPAYALHRDPDNFPDPEKFDPNRFLDQDTVNNAAYIPFGKGPRMCIASRFALLETKVVIFQLLAHCDLKPCPKTSIPLDLTCQALQVDAANGFWMKVQPRTNLS